MLLDHHVRHRRQHVRQRHENTIDSHRLLFGHVKVELVPLVVGHDSLYGAVYEVSSLCKGLHGVDEVAEQRLGVLLRAELGRLLGESFKELVGVTIARVHVLESLFLHVGHGFLHKEL